MKIQSRDSKIESLKVQVAIVHEQMKNLLSQRTDLSKIAIDVLKTYKAVGERPGFEQEGEEKDIREDFKTDDN
jgi:hypothetical protein